MSIAAGVDAAGHGLALRAEDRFAADRTTLRHHEGVLVAVALLDDGPDYLRDHIPSPLDHDDIADQDALLLYVVLVVQRRARDRHPPDVHRLQDRLRRQGPRPADVDDDVVESSPARERLELVGYRPARGLGDSPQGALLLPRVHLHDDAVDLKG
jgi:hypothetical protein